MRHLERTKAPRNFSSLGKRLKYPALVDLEGTSKAVRAHFQSVPHSHPALGMTVVGELCLALGWKLFDGMSFLFQTFSSLSEEGLGLSLGVCAGDEDEVRV